MGGGSIVIPSVIRSTAVRNVYDPTNVCSMTRKQELVGLTSVYKELKKKKNPSLQHVGTYSKLLSHTGTGHNV